MGWRVGTPPAPTLWQHLPAPGSVLESLSRTRSISGFDVAAASEPGSRLTPAATLQLRSIQGTDSGGAELGLRFQSRECQCCLPNCSAWHKFPSNPHSGTFFFGFVLFVAILFCDLLFLKLLFTYLKLFPFFLPAVLKMVLKCAF